MEFLVFEDILSGVTAATRAGLRPFGIQENKLMLEKLSIANRVYNNLYEAFKYINANNMI